MQDTRAEGGSRAEQVLHMASGHAELLCHAPDVGVLQQAVKDKGQVESVHHSSVHALGMKQGRIQGQDHTEGVLLVLQGASPQLYSCTSPKHGFVTPNGIKPGLVQSICHCHPGHPGQQNGKHGLVWMAALRAGLNSSVAKWSLVMSLGGGYWDQSC